METPTFKQLLKADVHNIFLNPEEFGERHRVNGKIMVIVLDDMEIRSADPQSFWQHGTGNPLPLYQ